MSAHDDEILGKAYDARLMRRLLEYLRPYTRQVCIALAAIVAGSAASLAQPYLIKVAIDNRSDDGGDSWCKLWREFSEVSSVLFVAQ